MRPAMFSTEMTRDISYAPAVRSRGGRALVRLLETATGRPSLIRRAEGYQKDIAEGRSLWQVLPERYGLSLDLMGGDLDAIPRQGPLIVVANHPFGILDGLMLGHLLDRARGDFRILANAVFRRAPELDKVLLPISFDDTREAARQNLHTRDAALALLSEGGTIGIFPGGTVSTSLGLFSYPMDPTWRNFTAKMIAKSGATVLPVFFDGHNSGLFQLASRLHSNLRLGLLVSEFRARTDTPVRVVIGKPMTAQSLGSFGNDASSLMRHLRQVTYALSPRPLSSYALGYEFEARYKPR